ncbi:MAG TPA: HAMP domain-containing sensor histidine kinase [Thermomicrobiales bacterium]|nr:HAMP domain-containing sensor histidine kinase [Thermomicrobiales bacterium]
MTDGRYVVSSELDGNRLLATLERLLAIDETDLHRALDRACHMVAEALRADKVDAALYDAGTETLIAAGTSDTPMGRKQHAIGMNRLPVANGGREVDVFLSGVPYATGQADQDPGQLRGMTEGLGIRSAIMVPLEVAGTRRGVFLASSARPNFFTEDDVRFLEAVSRWVGMVAQRAELTERIATEAREQGRRVAADELIATLAHDLGNLLAPVKGRIDLLRRRARREDRQRDLRDIEEAARAVDRVVALVADLLDSSRLEQGLFALNRQPVDLVDLVRETCAALTTNTVPIRIQVSDQDVVLAMDPNRIRQALENLLSNAIRFSPAGAAVVVELDVDSSGAESWAVVTVTDQGPGIPPELFPRLFDRFARGPGSSGLGIGLYLASRIVAAHGGTLTADPNATIGARFQMQLPLAEAPISAGGG